MDELRKILNISSYRPEGGYAKELIELAISGLRQAEAISVWKSKGRSQNSFYEAKRNIQHKLLNNIHIEKELTEIENKRVHAWERYFQIKKLMVLKQKGLAMSRAIDALNFAKKCDLTIIVANLAHHLENYHGAITGDTQRYLRYRKIRKEYQKRLIDEMDIQGLSAQFVHTVNKRKDWKVLEPEILAIKEKGGSTLFTMHRYLILSNWYEMTGNYDKVVETYRETLDKIEQSNFVLPFVARTDLIQRLVPMLIAKGHYAEAERKLNKVLPIMPPGKNGWHYMLTHMATIGLWSGKYSITESTINKANRTAHKQGPMLRERWLILSAYLALFRDEKFKVGKFINEVPTTSQHKTGEYISIIIAEMLHYLKSGNEKAFMKRSDTLPNYINEHLKGKTHARPRAMLYALHSVEMGGYFRQRVLGRAKRHVKVFKQPPVTVHDYEVFPYRKVWEFVMGCLK